MKAKITSSASVLLVKDVVLSAEWYKEKCGFKINNFYGEPPNFAIINRDKHYLMFAKCKPGKIMPNWKLLDKTSNVYFWVNDAEKMYKEFIATGATIDYELCVQPYGVKEFGINDPDG